MTPLLQLKAFQQQLKMAVKYHVTVTECRKAIQTVAKVQLADKARNGVSNYLNHTESTADKHYRMIIDKDVAKTGKQIAELVVSLLLKISMLLYGLLSHLYSKSAYCSNSFNTSFFCKSSVEPIIAQSHESIICADLCIFKLTDRKTKIKK